MSKKKRRSRIKKANTSKWGRPNDGEVKVTHINATIAIPSGRCPAELKGDDRQSIREWLVAVTESKPSAHSYQASVYKYWVRDFYESYSDEYKDIGEIIDSMIMKPVKTISDIGV